MLLLQVVAGLISNISFFPSDTFFLGCCSSSYSSYWYSSSSFSSTATYQRGNKRYQERRQSQLLPPPRRPEDLSARRGRRLFFGSVYNPAGEWCCCRRRCHHQHRDGAVPGCAQVNVQNAYGNSPLHEAARHGFVEITSVLISRGVFISMTNNKGSIALHLASYGADAREFPLELTRLLAANIGIWCQRTGQQGLHGADGSCQQRAWGCAQPIARQRRKRQDCWRDWHGCSGYGYVPRAGDLYQAAQGFFQGRPRDTWQRVRKVNGETEYVHTRAEGCVVVYVCPVMMGWFGAIHLILIIYGSCAFPWSRSQLLSATEALFRLISTF